MPFFTPLPYRLVLLPSLEILTMFTKTLETSLNFLTEPFNRQVIKPGTHIPIVGQSHTGRSSLATHIARDLLQNNALEEGVLYLQDEGDTAERVKLFPEDKRDQLVVERLFISDLDGTFAFNYVRKHEPRPVVVLDLMTLSMRAGIDYNKLIKTYCEETGAVVISVHTLPPRRDGVVGAALGSGMRYSFLDATEHERSNTIPVFTRPLSNNEPVTADFLPLTIRTHKSAEELIANYTVCIPRVGA